MSIIFCDVFNLLQTFLLQIISSMYRNNYSYIVQLTNLIFPSFRYKYKLFSLEIQKSMLYRGKSQVHLPRILVIPHRSTEQRNKISMITKIDRLVYTSRDIAIKP